MKGGTIALLLAALPTMVQAQMPGPTESTPRTVTVNASADVEREPDRAVLMLAVESDGETAEAAAAANAERMERVLAALRRMELPDREIRTISYSLNPIYSQPPRDPRPMEPQEPRIVGYRAMNMVRVGVNDVERAGEIIDGALEAGANRVAGVNFELQDPQPAQTEALRLAVERARVQAQAAAQAAGQRLGRPMNIMIHDGGYSPPPPMPYAMARMDAAEASTPIQGGVMQIRTNVTVVYELLDG